MASNGDSPLLSRLRLWTSRPRPARGPAPAYTREQIADTAIAIADLDGLDAVTMRRVATELGTGAMSLYRYVENKEALLELVADRMYARHEWPELTGRWRQDLREFARAHRRALLERPWLKHVWNGRAVGPNIFRHFERAVSAMDGLGLGIEEMVEAVLLVLTWVDGYTRQELEVLTYVCSPNEEEIGRELNEYVQAVVHNGEHPYLARFVDEALSAQSSQRSSQFPRFAADAWFDRALDRVLAGIEATLPAETGTGK